MEIYEEKYVPPDLLYSKISRIFRFIQLIACLASLIGALIITRRDWPLVTGIISAICLFGFLLVLIDFYAGYSLKQYTVPIWCPIAIFASLIFILAFSLIIFRHDWLHLLLALLFFVTAFLFLLESILILYQLFRVYYPAKVHPFDRLIPGRTRHCSNACSGILVPCTRDNAIQCGYQVQDVYDFGSLAPCPNTRRLSQCKTTSYGGTFPMGKDCAPLPTPERLTRTRACPNNSGNVQVLCHKRIDSPKQLACSTSISTRELSNTPKYCIKYETPRCPPTCLFNRWVNECPQDETCPRRTIVKEKCTQYLCPIQERKPQEAVQTENLVPCGECTEQVTPFVQHHYSQSPCVCGYTHYQASTIVQGAVKQCDSIKEQQRSISRQITNMKDCYALPNTIDNNCRPASGCSLQKPKMLIYKEDKATEVYQKSRLSSHHLNETPNKNKDTCNPTKEKPKATSSHKTSSILSWKKHKNKTNNDECLKNCKKNVCEAYQETDSKNNSAELNEIFVKGKIEMKASPGSSLENNANKRVKTKIKSAPALFKHCNENKN